MDLAFLVRSPWPVAARRAVTDQKPEPLASARALQRRGRALRQILLLRVRCGRGAAPLGPDQRSFAHMQHRRRASQLRRQTHLTCWRTTEVTQLRVLQLLKAPSQAGLRSFRWSRTVGSRYPPFLKPIHA